MKTLRDQRGVAMILEIVLVVAVLGVAGVAIWKFTNRDKPEQSGPKGGPQFSVGSKTKQQFRFQRFPFDLKDIGSMAPVGEFAGVTRQTAPTSHFAGNYRHYIFSKEPGKRAYNVYVPADGEITRFRASAVTGQFRFDFKINDKALYFIDHIQSLTPEMKTKLEGEFGSPLPEMQGVEQLKHPIKVKAGEVLGQTGLKGIAWDWGVMDEADCAGVTFPEHYNQDMCAQSAWDYMTDDMKKQIAPYAGYWTPPPMGQGLKPVRTTPLLGQYGQDVKGALSGGWFQVARGWQNAFFVPDAYEPNALAIRVAIPELSVFGVFNGLPIGTNINPDPKKVTKDSGIVGYVLDKTKARDNNEYGVLLVRVNADDSITLETISGTTAVPANPQFSAKAVTIKR